MFGTPYTENEQQTGSFKVRGAVNKLRILQDTGKYSADRPPVTASTGNHALACVRILIVNIDVHI